MGWTCLWGRGIGRLLGDRGGKKGLGLEGFVASGSWEPWSENLGVGYLGEENHLSRVESVILGRYL